MSVDQAFRKAVDVLGSQSAVAKAAGKVKSWAHDGVHNRLKYVTVGDAFALERATNGAVKASDFICDVDAGEAAGEPPEAAA